MKKIIFKIVLISYSAAIILPVLLVKFFSYLLIPSIHEPGNFSALLAPYLFGLVLALPVYILVFCIMCYIERKNKINKIVLLATGVGALIVGLYFIPNIISYILLHI